MRDSLYFEQYNSLGIHQAMLNDKPRMNFYRKCVMDNRAMFKDKIVLDVGCGILLSFSKLIQVLSNLISQFAGLGCLSIFAARAGAKKVYAVEASRQTFELALGAFAKSGFDSIIEAINAPIEEAVIGDRFVDIIISEWMGYW